MIYAKSKGDTKDTEKALKKMRSGDIYRVLSSYGRRGVDALSSATPIDTSDTANSWAYQVGHTNGVYSITWLNTNVEGGVNVAIILQYGHGTGTGGYVVGRNYIMPAIKPVFDKIAEDVWRQVKYA